MLHTLQDLLVVHLCLKIHPEERQVLAVMSGGDKVSLMHRLAPEVVAARQAMLDRCLVSITPGPCPFQPGSPDAGVFWRLPESHWQAAGQAGAAGAGQACAWRAGRP